VIFENLPPSRSPYSTGASSSDLRGNGLSGLTSATALRGATLSGIQVPTFTDLVLRELAMTIAGG
jgi:hypothetical protein